MRVYDTLSLLQDLCINVGRRLQNFLNYTRMLFCADRKFDYPKSVCNLGDGCFTPGIFGHAIRMKDDTVEIPSFIALSAFE